VIMSSLVASAPSQMGDTVVEAVETVEIVEAVETVVEWQVAAGPPDLARLWGVDGGASKGERDDVTRGDAELGFVGGGVLEDNVVGVGVGEKEREVLLTLMSEGCVLLDFLGKVKGGGEVGGVEGRTRDKGGGGGEGGGGQEEAYEEHAERITCDIRHVSKMGCVF